MARDLDYGDANVQTATVVLPAGDADSGGDFQLVRTHGTRTIALVGDVAGNGTDAAPYAERLCRQLQRNIDSADPVDLLAELNSQIYADPGFDRFVSKLNGASADEVVSTLKDVACAFGEGHLPDDLCLLALRVA